MGLLRRIVDDDPYKPHKYGFGAWCPAVSSDTSWSRSAACRALRYSIPGCFTAELYYDVK